MDNAENMRMDTPGGENKSYTKGKERSTGVSIDGGGSTKHVWSTA